MLSRENRKTETRLRFSSLDTKTDLALVINDYVIINPKLSVSNNNCIVISHVWNQL